MSFFVGKGSKSCFFYVIFNGKGSIFGRLIILFLI